MSDDNIRRTREQIAQLEAEIADFQASSRELETEMEQELEESERKIRNLEDQVYSITQDRDKWRDRFLEQQKEFAASHASLTKQIHTLEKAHTAANSRLREIEMENDDMERNERITKSTLDDMESRYHGCLEEIAMLEADVAGKDNLKAELQRSKDEVRETNEELVIALAKIEQLKLKSGDEENRTPPLHMRTASAKYQRPVVTTTAANGNMFPTRRLASSRSLRKIHGIIDQLESRVATFKSSLPNITPKGSPAQRAASSPECSPPPTSKKFSRDVAKPAPETTKNAKSTLSEVAKYTKAESTRAKSDESRDSSTGSQRTLAENILDKHTDFTSFPILHAASSNSTPEMPPPNTPTPSHKRLSPQSSRGSLYTLGHRRTESFQHRTLPTMQQRRYSSSSPTKGARSLSTSPTKPGFPSSPTKTNLHVNRQRALRTIDGSPVSSSDYEQGRLPDEATSGTNFSSLHSRYRTG